MTDLDMFFRKSCKHFFQTFHILGIHAEYLFHQMQINHAPGMCMKAQTSPHGHYFLSVFIYAAEYIIINHPKYLHVHSFCRHPGFPDFWV